MKNVFLGIAIAFLLVAGILSLQSAQMISKMEHMDADQLSKTGKAYFRTGKLKEADMHISKAIEKDPYNKEAQCYNLLILLKNNKYTKACEEAKKVAEMFPDDAFVLTTVATAYLGKKDYENAEKYLLQSIEIEPIHVSYRALGITYKAQKKYREAIDAYTQAINLKPDNIKYYKARKRVCKKIGDMQCVENDEKKIAELRATK